MQRNSGLRALALVCLLAAPWAPGCSVREAPPAPAPTNARRAITVPDGFDWLNVELNTSNPLVAPMKMTVAPDGRVFVCEQAGRVRVVKHDVLLPVPLLSLDNVNSQSDNGLQAIALDPDFATAGAPGHGRFFVYYHRKAIAPGTHPVGRVASYRVSATNPDVADPTPLATLDLDELRTPSGGIPGSHVGGTLAVGKDGMLYLALGYADVSTTDQRSWTHSATKILRMRLSDLGPAPGNPFVTTGTNEIMKRVWARGLRNPFSLAVHRSTGRMFFDDVGSNHVITPSTRPPKNAWEETNHVPNPGEDPGVTGAPFDFGWPLSEGDGPHLVHVYMNGQANENTGGQDCAKIGGTFYDPPNPTFPPQYIGGYFYADYCSGYVEWLPPAQQTPTVDDGDPNTWEVPANVAIRFVDTLGISPTDLEVAPDGSLYFLGRSTPERAPSAVGYMGKIFASGPVPQVSITAPAEGTRVSTGGTGAVDVAVTAVASDAHGGVSAIELFAGTTAIGSCAASPCSATAQGLTRGTHRLTARATNVVGGQKVSAPVTVTVDGPSAVISAPAAGSTYVAGQAISFAGSATDFEGGAITSPSAFTWNIYLRHGTHAHLAHTATGTSGSFTPSTSAETDPNVHYDFVLTVTDSFGTAHSTSRAVLPVKPTLTLATSPVSGLQIKLEGAFKSTPFSFQSVAGITRVLEAPRKQTGPNGRRYEFTSWQDNGSTGYLRSISTPLVDTTYRANFRDATGSGTGLHGEYFADATLTSKIFERTDATIDFDWGAGAPPGLPADGFSVRWTGKVQPFFTESQSFYVEADGGVRVWFRGTLIVDSWNESSAERVTAEQGSITGGAQYDLRVEYRDTAGPARVRLYWAGSGVLKEVVPTSQLYPAVTLTPQKPALLVVSSAGATAADLALKARLENQLGLPTDVVGATSLTTPMATAPGRQVVVVSETVASAEVNTKLTSAPVPVVVHEPSIMDDMGMTGPTFGTHYGDATGQTTLTIAAPASPLAAGLSGTPAVVGAASTFVWGIPAAAGTAVAYLAGSSTRAAIYAYEAGAAMVAGTAPARRVGSFIHGGTPSNLNANGWALFDAGVRWAASVDPPANQAPVVSAGPDLATTVGVTTTISGSVSDDGLPVPPSLTIGWSAVSGPAAPSWPLGDQSQPVTNVQFPVAGTYVLRLSAHDGALGASDDVVVTVAQPVVATPTISPNGGTFTGPQSVTLSTTTSGAEIRYTLDGSTPSASSVLYTGPFTVDRSLTVRARGFKAGFAESAVASATFTVTGKTALLVVGSTSLTTSDAALRNRLETRGFTVTVRSGAAVVPADAAGKSVVVISMTVTAADINTELNGVTVPIINLEPQLMDDLGMTGTSSGTHFGTQNRTSLYIAASGHALAAGLTGNPTVTTASRPFVWGVPGASAAVIAKTTSTANRAVIFKYEAGATMINGVAAGKRMGFFSGDTTAQSHNANGWALFDAALGWAAP